jgi:hypothetical protein
MPRAAPPAAGAARAAPAARLRACAASRRAPPPAAPGGLHREREQRAPLHARVARVARLEERRRRPKHMGRTHLMPLDASSCGATQEDEYGVCEVDGSFLVALGFVAQQASCLTAGAVAGTYCGATAGAAVFTGEAEAAVAIAPLCALLGSAVLDGNACCLGFEMFNAGSTAAATASAPPATRAFCTRRAALARQLTRPAPPRRFTTP